MARHDENTTDPPESNVAQLNPDDRHNHSESESEPNGWTRGTRIVLMLGCLVALLLWWGRFILGLLEDEPSLGGSLFLAGMALSATTNGQKMILGILDGWRARK